MNTHGITFVTVFALICGVLLHIFKHVKAARRNGVKINLRSYVMDNQPETFTALLCAVVFYLALPELVSFAPDFAKSVGFETDRTVLSSFIAGYMGNSLADFLGGRVSSLTGTKEE